MSTLRRALVTAAAAAVPTTMIAPAAATEPVKIFDAATDYGVELVKGDFSSRVGYQYNAFFDETTFSTSATIFNVDVDGDTRVGDIFIGDIVPGTGSARVLLANVSFGYWSDEGGNTYPTATFSNMSSSVAIGQDGRADMTGLNYVVNDGVYALIIVPEYEEGQSTNLFRFYEHRDVAFDNNGEISQILGGVGPSDIQPGIYTGGDYNQGFTDRLLYQGDTPLFSVFAAAAVPEPDDYAMFLAGLGLVGLAARRRMSANDRGVSAPSMDA